MASGGAVSCTSFADDAAWKLTVHIKNQKSSTIYLGPQETGCAVGSLFEVADGSRTVLPGLDKCRASCSAVLQGAAPTCATACQTPATVALGPGQSIDIPWDGLVGVPSTVPAQCMQGMKPDTACVRAQQIKSGIFTFTARSGSQRMCLSPSTCTCTANADGTCTMQNSVIAGTITTSDFLIALDPTDNTVGVQSQYIAVVFK